MKVLDQDAILKLKSNNYRKLNEGRLACLQESILAVGVREAVSVYQCTDVDETYILAGHHRIEAVSRLMSNNPCLSIRVPANVKRGPKADMNSRDQAISSIISNSMRSNLSVLERATAYQKLLEAGLATPEVAKMMGCSLRTVEKVLNVAAMPRDYQEKLVEEGIGDAKLYSIAAKYKRNPDLSYEKLVFSSKKLGSSKNDVIKIQRSALMKVLLSSKVSQNKIDMIMGQI